jgi:hypothetical protein
VKCEGPESVMMTTLSASRAARRSRPNFASGRSDKEIFQHYRGPCLRSFLFRWTLVRRTLVRVSDRRVRDAIEGCPKAGDRCF